MTVMTELVKQRGELNTWAVIDAWLAQVSKSNSERTRGDYHRHLMRFAQTVPLEDATPAHVQAFAYGRGLSGRDPSSATIAVRLAAVNSFYDFASRMTGIPNPCANVKRPRTQGSQPRGLSKEELEALLRVIPNTPAGLRDRAIILASVYTGLRRAEIMGLRAGDLSRNGCAFYSVKVKGGEVRTRELPQPAFEAICAALDAQQRPLATLAPDDKIFDISGATYYAYLRKYGKRAGLSIRPHDLRHTGAKLRRATGASIEDVSAFLGHANLATTATYLKRLEGSRDPGWQLVADYLDGQSG